MRRAGIWFWLSCKRYLCRLSFLLILFLLPAGAFFVRGLEKEEGTQIRIAVCIGEASEPEEAAQGQPMQDALVSEPTSQELSASEPSSLEPSSLEQEVLGDLTARGRSDGIFLFYPCDSEEELKEEVASRRAECGYVFSPGLREKLDEKSYKRCIRVYSAPSTVTAELSAEVVFAALIRRYDRELFLQYVDAGEAFSSIADGEQREALKEAAGALYDAWMEDGGTFRFVYEYGQKDAKPGTGGQTDARLFPVRGIAAVYVFIIGLYGAAVSLTDEKKGLYHMLPASSRIPCQLASMMGPVALAAVSGGAALAVSGSLTGIGKEAAAMAVYAAAVTAFSWLVRQVCRRDAAVCCLIPFFLIGSLVFCPVIIDVGRYVPSLSFAGRWFLPWYYLRLF